MNIGKKEITDAQRRIWEKQALNESQRFDAMNAEEWFANQKYQADHIEILGIIQSWYEKSKPNTPLRLTLNTLFGAVIRADHYLQHLLTTMRQGTVFYLKEKDRRIIAEEQVAKLNAEVELLKKEIKFHEKNK